jgi:glycoprotein endo-alpha-1,2-mannosidase
VSVGMGGVHDGRARTETAAFGEELDRPQAVLGETFLDLARLLVGVHMQGELVFRRVAPKLLEPVPRAGANGVRGNTDANSRGAQLVEPAQIVGDGALPEALDAAACVGDVEQDDLDPRLCGGLRGSVRFREAEIVELADGGVARAAELPVDPGIALADQSRCLTPGQVQHGLAPRPEVRALGPSAQRPLESVTVRVDETGELETVHHAREDTRVLRRLLVVGVVGAFLTLPALAHAGTVAIFYYPWYGNPTADGSWLHWNQNNHQPPNDLYSRFYPAQGPYSSSDPRVVAQEMAQISSAGIDEVVVSWWGRGSVEDQRLPLVISAARRRGLVVGIHLEPYEGRSPATVAQDLAYFATLGVPDVYVYHPRDFSAADWTALRAQTPAQVRLLAGTELVGFAAAAHFDGFYTYDFNTYDGSKFIRLCAQAHALHLVCGPSVGPGYNGTRAGETSGRRPRAQGATYDRLWSAALAASPDLVTITSYNEWGEGTQIEPAQARPGYASYDGAWGLTGAAAQNAYLLRTAYWTARYHALH